MPRVKKTLDLTNEIEDKLEILKKTGKGKKKEEVVEEEVEEEVKEVVKPTGRVRPTEDLKEVVKPDKVFDKEEMNRTMEEMFKKHMESMPKPVIQEANIVVNKKTRKEPVAKAVQKKVVKPKSVMEVDNEEMIRAEYLKEIRQRMMRNLFDY